MPGRWAFKIDGREIDPANGCSLRGKREMEMPFYRFWGAEWQKVMLPEWGDRALSFVSVWACLVQLWCIPAC